MMRTHLQALLAALVILGAAGCSGEGENRFRDNRPEFMRELKAALTKSKIPFREDAEGFIRYSSAHDRAVNELRAALHKELQGGVVWRLDDQRSREYLLGLFGSMGVKYILEPRGDGEWIRWFPKDQAQEREIGLKVAEHTARLARQDPKQGTAK